MAKALGKSDITASVAAKLKSSHTDASRSVNAVLETVTEALKAGRSVRLTGFGTFDVRHIGPRRVRALRGRQAGQMLTVPPHKRPGFRPGTELRRAVMTAR
ncbi:MAG TPA: HU family DNA-binding protein [Chloroflexota bacterium]|jgi:DNA-binding protein HU-beta